MSPKITFRNIPSIAETMNQVFFLSTPTKTNMKTIIEQIVHNQFQTCKPSKKNVYCLLWKIQSNLPVAQLALTKIAWRNQQNACPTAEYFKAGASSNLPKNFSILTSFTFSMIGSMLRVRPLIVVSGYQGLPFNVQFVWQSLIMIFVSQNFTIKVDCEWSF